MYSYFEFFSDEGRIGFTSFDLIKLSGVSFMFTLYVSIMFEKYAQNTTAIMLFHHSQTIDDSFQDPLMVQDMSYTT